MYAFVLLAYKDVRMCHLFLYMVLCAAFIASSISLGVCTASCALRPAPRVSGCWDEVGVEWSMCGRSAAVPRFLTGLILLWSQDHAGQVFCFRGCLMGQRVPRAQYGIASPLQQPALSSFTRYISRASGLWEVSLPRKGLPPGSGGEAQAAWNSRARERSLGVGTSCSTGAWLRQPVSEAMAS